MSFSSSICRTTRDLLLRLGQLHLLLASLISFVFWRS